jgi:hypothetical protein
MTEYERPGQCMTTAKRGVLRRFVVFIAKHTGYSYWYRMNQTQAVQVRKQAAVLRVVMTNAGESEVSRRRRVKKPLSVARKKILKKGLLHVLQGKLEMKVHASTLISAGN